MGNGLASCKFSMHWVGFGEGTVVVDVVYGFCDVGFGKVGGNNLEFFGD